MAQIGFKNGTVDDITAKRATNEVGTASSKNGAQRPERKIFSGGDVGHRHLMLMEEVGEEKVVDVTAMVGDKDDRTRQGQGLPFFNFLGIDINMIEEGAEEACQKAADEFDDRGVDMSGDFTDVARGEELEVAKGFSLVDGNGDESLFKMRVGDNSFNHPAPSRRSQTAGDTVEPSPHEGRVTSLILLRQSATCTGMGQIQHLSPELIGKIAAGEVVERPASVVKELIENALDAGATSLRIEVKAGGKTRIVVSDDGFGMDPHDARCCLDRHATSKIRSEDDLWSMATFGFRGEALAAIAAVSRLMLETKLRDAHIIEGLRVRCEGGGALDVVPCGCPGGTRVEIRDLFYNVPARLKFLKSETVEVGHIVEAVQAAALAHPAIRFECIRDGRVQWVLAPASLHQRVADIIGSEEAKTFRCFEEASDGISLTGWLTTGEMHRATSKNLWLFVNGRPLRDKLLLHAVTHGFGETLPRGRYPTGAVFLSIDPRKVDVNVHPTKREVRFENGGAVHDFVAKVVRKSFIPSVIARSAEQNRSATWQSPEEPGDRHAPSELAVTPQITFDVPSNDPIRILGQLAKTYIVCEGPEDSLVLFDQHAAHERLGFNILKQQFSGGTIAQQRLLIPQHVALTPAAAGRLRDSLDILQRAGFEVEPFSGTSFSVKAVPAILGDADLSSLLEQVAHELEEAGSSGAPQMLFDRLFSVVACHRQIRGGDMLASQEMAALLRDVDQQGITHCPHGRPVLITFDRGEIERRFKRT